MNRSATNSNCLRGWVLAVLIFSTASALPQTEKPSGQTSSGEKVEQEKKQPPPTFSPSGINGNIAPSGYSTGVSRGEISEIGKGVNDINHEFLSDFIPGGSVEDCRREPELINKAKAEPAIFQSNYALGVFYLEHGEFAQSIPYLQAARHADPANINSSRALALALLGSKRNPEAIALLEQVSGGANSDPISLRLLALAYQLSGDRRKSVETYQRAASTGGPENVFDCGLGLIRAGAPEIAARVFSTGITAHPDQAKLWLGLGLVQALNQKKIEAIQSLLRAVAMDPEYTPAYFFLAGLADASPEHATEIRKRLAEFAVAHPNSPDAHYDYALALWKQHKTNPGESSTAEIQSQLERALTLSPNMARAHFQLGVIFADANDFANAERELSRAAELEPDNAEAHYRLAQAYQRTRKPELANTEMQRFLALHNRERTEENSFIPELWDPGADLASRIAFAPRCNGQY